ncbi:MULTISPECIES: LTA synthase family protein [Vibrio]|uniref:LTA synthase family protein n=1 Tax=Vibrio TaxID=662 RepID=UPI00187EF38A|nr:MULTISPECIES: LTA synthase family protein [Vibrio]EGX6961253.1 LTA synthase family protein [Vibrio alginolyticus]EJE3286012.1 LTA synthase family protein [Vibrio alginolyticus]EJN3356471.1 LTA synthase family protein [Vibrio alginolyticus]EJS0369637.1 LTA synthase family protein [Vibrio alginolyticus]EJX2553348.1 LTA synthase family protein [Vibrio alginolyticus]
MKNLSKSSVWGPLQPIAAFSLFSLLFLSISRVLLAFWQIDRIDSLNDLIYILGQGLRVDIATLCWLFILPALFSTFMPLTGKMGECWKRILRIWMVLGLWVLVYMELATAPFIQEYDLRPNRLFVEYLIYPKEVLSMLWTGYKLELFIGALGTVLTITLGWKWSKKLTDKAQQVNWKWRPLLALFVVLFGVAGARSSLGHRPLNPAMVAFSNDPLLNDLALNSSYSLLFAVNSMKSEKSAEQFYGKMDTQKMLELVRTSSTKSDFTPSLLPTMNSNPATYQGKHKNLVILLQESLGAQFVGALGGLPLTPNLDELMKEGWQFTQMYATGTRSVRGIEAVTTGFPPSPSRAVVKLSKSQTGFFTIADLLKAQGYHTQFIYGGEANFDNMKTFFFGNGFDQIVEEDDYNNPSFVGSWGVSDEDLYNKANEEFERLSKSDKPFFSLVFTSSNHSPYEYPQGKIEPYDSEHMTRNNAVKYSDYALGTFFEKAKKSSYWDDTIFIVIADHDARVSGANLVPVKHFHIPALILGKGIQPRKDDRIANNIDMPPTLLSLIGVDAKTPMIGRDLTKPLAREDERAMMQYDKNFGYLTRDNLVVLSPGEKISTLAYDFKDQTMKPLEVDESIIERAKANALFASKAYQNNWYSSKNTH